MPPFCVALGATTDIGTTELEVEVTPQLASEATEANQSTSTAESLSNLPPELVELLNGNLDIVFKQIGAKTILLFVRA